VGYLPRVNAWTLLRVVIYFRHAFTFIEKSLPQAKQTATRNATDDLRMVALSGDLLVAPGCRIDPRHGHARQHGFINHKETTKGGFWRNCPSFI
jgi:hypothetical protein